jgi:hypothetical protein
MHIEFLVEEDSSAEALKFLVPKIVGNEVTFFLHSFQGKRDLLDALPERLEGYSKWLPDDWRIVVLTDRDDDDCLRLKRQLDEIAMRKHLVTASSRSAGISIQVLNRIAVEELEAWFFGDVDALVAAYPRVPATLARKRGFRDSDGITGGTWEALERTLQRAGYYRAGMPKIEVARKVSALMEPRRNRSGSFKTFCAGLMKLIT